MNGKALIAPPDFCGFGRLKIENAAAKQRNFARRINRGQQGTADQTQP
jgi:hypothetical protein